MTASSHLTACLEVDHTHLGRASVTLATDMCRDNSDAAHPAAAVLGLRTTLDGRGGRTSTALVCGRGMLPAAAAALKDDALWDWDRPRVGTLASEARRAAALDGSLTRAA